jgi:hypothetical protein
MSIEDKIEKELPQAFEKSKIWCYNNLSSNLSGYEYFDLNIFNYIIDTKSNPISDMYFKLEDNGLIRVNTHHIEWLIKRQETFPYEPEVDLESMFIHEMVEYIVEKNMQIMIAYLPDLKLPHMLAKDMENINRKERNLKEWMY